MKSTNVPDTVDSFDESASYGLPLDYSSYGVNSSFCVLALSPMNFFRFALIFCVRVLSGPLNLDDFAAIAEYAKCGRMYVIFPQ